MQNPEQTEIGDQPENGPDETPLRRGWTTGACATAATKAAVTALITGTFPDPVEIVLPRGEEVSFPLAVEGLRSGEAMAGIVKDAGDDPDVTHGALICATVKLTPGLSGVAFAAGEGVGTVTKPGLPIPPGEPAINPVPRSMMRQAVHEVLAAQGWPTESGIRIEISVPEGRALATQTWNPRLGIVGGLSILGTTGIVRPFSCAAWIASIHRGVDVARASGLTHVVGSTGATSERVAQDHLALPEFAYLDMGDFVGGLLKYLKVHPVPRLTIAGGFAKLVKLAQGHGDLHSGRSQVSFEALAALATSRGDSDLGSRIRAANTANQVLEMCTARDIPVATLVAEAARHAALRFVGPDYPGEIDIMVVDRDARLRAWVARDGIMDAGNV